MMFTEALKKSIENWPDSIDISDGENVCHGGGLFQGLSRIWDRIEKAAEEEGDIEGLMTWAIFSAFHKASVELFKNGVTKVSKSDLDLNYLHAKFNESFYAEESGYEKYSNDWNDDFGTNT